MLLALAQRVALGFPLALRASASVRATQIHNLTAFSNPCLLSRPFLTTTRVDAAAATKKTATAPKKKTDSKTSTTKKATGTRKTSGAKKSTGAKKVVKRTTGAKTPAKKKGTGVRAKKSKKAKVVKKLKPTSKDKPPKSPPPPFLLYVQEVLRSEETVNRQTIPGISKKAGASWNEMTPEQKKTYSDRYRTLFQEYLHRKYAYYEKVSPTTLRRLNAIRVARKKLKYRMCKRPEHRRPKTSYLRFLDDFRATPEAEAAGTQGPHAKKVVNVVTAGAKAWQALSEDQKKKYADAAKVEWDAYKARHPSSKGGSSA